MENDYKGAHISKLIDEFNQFINKDNTQIDEKLSQEYSDARIDPNEELKPPQTAFKQILDNGEERIFGTLGNFSLLSGKAKSRKSFLVNMIVAALLSGKDVNGIKGCLPDDKRKGILIDTEQGKYHVQLALKRIRQLSGERNTDNLDVIALRKYKPNDRLKLVEHGIYNTKKLGYVVIDGIRDLINSINDEEAATMLTSKFLKWTEELNIHVIVVLHQNKSNENVRGHIGSEVVNKTETHLSVVKSIIDKNITEVIPMETRNREPEPFAFEIFDGMPVIAEDYELRTAEKSNDIDVSKIDASKVYLMFKIIFERDKEYAYSHLMTQVKLEFNKTFHKKIGDNKVKELITLSRNNNWVLQEGLRKPYTLGNFIE